MTIIKDLELSTQKWAQGYKFSDANSSEYKNFVFHFKDLLLHIYSDETTLNFKTFLDNKLLLKEGDVLTIGSKDYIVSYKNKALIFKEFLKQRNIKAKKLSITPFFVAKSNVFFEKEIGTVAVSHFLSKIKNNNYQDLDVAFIEEMVLVTPKLFDQLKIIFFTMSKNEELKKDPFFKTLYYYIFNNNFQKLYDYFSNLK